MSERPRATTGADAGGEIQLADFLEQYVGKYIALADTKAALTVTVAGGVLAYFLTREGFVAALKVWQASVSLFAWTATASLALSALLSFWVIWPRRRTSAEGIIYWRSIAQFARADQFVDRVRGSSQQQIAYDRLVHCYDISRVCTTKYDVLAFAMPIGMIGVLAAFASLLLVGDTP